MNQVGRTLKSTILKTILKIKKKRKKFFLKGNSINYRKNITKKSRSEEFQKCKVEL